MIKNGEGNKECHISFGFWTTGRFKYQLPSNQVTSPKIHKVLRARSSIHQKSSSTTFCRHCKACSKANKRNMGDKFLDKEGEIAKMAYAPEVSPRV